MSRIRLHNTEIKEDDRLGAVMFYAFWTKRQNQGKSTDGSREFAGIPYAYYDYAATVNARPCPRGNRVWRSK